MPRFDFTQFPTLETERLLLREIHDDDARDWLAAWNHPEGMRYLIEFDRGYTDLAEVQGIIQWTQSIFADKSGVRWAICRKPDDTMIGSCGFHIYSARNRSAEIGYELHHAYWRQGIMREALSEVLRFLFDALELHRVEANVTVGNEASAGILKALGFQLEGTWRDKEFGRGAFHSLWQFGLLETEYRTRA